MATKSTHLKVKGMHCTGCEETIENAVAHLPGVQKVKADYVKQLSMSSSTANSSGEGGIRRAIEEKGYEFESTSTQNSSHPVRNGLIFLSFLLVVGGVTFWGKSMIPGLVGEMNTQPRSCHVIFHRIFYRFSLHWHVRRFRGGLCDRSWATHLQCTTAMASSDVCHRQNSFLYGYWRQLGFIGFRHDLHTLHARRHHLAASIFVIIYGLKMLDVFPALRKLHLALASIYNERRSE